MSYTGQTNMIVAKRMTKKREAVWLFAGGSMQESMARAIKARGFALILTDFNKDCLCRPLADTFVCLDTFDIKGNILAAQKLVTRYNVKAVVTVGADCHETVAYVAEKIGVHGIDPRIAHICRQKQKTREVLSAAGIPQPLFAVVGTIDEARTVAQKIGFPCAIKATNNSGSRGFSKISKPADLNEAVLKVAIDSGTTGKAIIEELLIPITNEIAEQSVETVWHNGKMHWLNWVDRLFRGDLSLFPNIEHRFGKQEYWGIEIAHINPAIHSSATKEKVFELVYSAGKALGLHRAAGGHILKADIMLTSKGPYILEVTPRLSGGWDSAGTTPLRGGDFIGGVLSLALGEELTLEHWQKYFTYKEPSKYASVFSLPEKGRTDCIGRKFAIGSSYSREDSLKNAFSQLSKKKYL